MREFLGVKDFILWQSRWHCQDYSARESCGNLYVWYFQNHWNMVQGKIHGLHAKDEAFSSLFFFLIIIFILIFCWFSNISLGLLMIYHSSDNVVSPYILKQQLFFISLLHWYFSSVFVLLYFSALDIILWNWTVAFDQQYWWGPDKTVIWDDKVFYQAKNVVTMDVFGVRIFPIQWSQSIALWVLIGLSQMWVIHL